jgi:hypothetical protein
MFESTRKRATNAGAANDRENAGAANDRETGATPIARSLLFVLSTMRTSAVHRSIDSHDRLAHVALGVESVALRTRLLDRLDDLARPKEIEMSPDGLATYTGHIGQFRLIELPIWWKVE